MNGSERSLVSAIRGPITLITVGALFALNNFTPYTFSQTWPVLLIVFGLLSLMRRSLGPAPPPRYQSAAPPNPFPPAGSYRESQYPDPASQPGPAKGGFGSTARPNEPGQNPGGSV